MYSNFTPSDILDSEKRLLRLPTKLQERNESIVRNWVSGRSGQEIGVKFGLSSSRISQVVRKTLLRDHIRPPRETCRYVDEYPEGWFRCIYCISHIKRNDSTLLGVLNQEFAEEFSRFRCSECGEPSLYADKAFMGHYLSHYDFQKQMPQIWRGPAFYKPLLAVRQGLIAVSLLQYPFSSIPLQN